MDANKERQWTLILELQDHKVMIFKMLKFP